MKNKVIPANVGGNWADLQFFRHFRPFEIYLLKKFQNYFLQIGDLAKPSNKIIPLFLFQSDSKLSLFKTRNRRISSNAHGRFRISLTVENHILSSYTKVKNPLKNKATVQQHLQPNFDPSPSNIKKSFVRISK